jgi:hypothetical protein
MHVEGGGRDQASPAAGTDIVEHRTKRGKTLRGIIRTDLTEEEAKTIDPYSFKKDNGWFIRFEKEK